MKKPALDPITVEPETGSIYPAPFRAAVQGRARRRLTNPLGLTDFGVNVTELAPGAASAHRHWHAQEDEFIWVLEGELTLVTDAGEQVLRAGQCAGFPKGAADGHVLINKSAKPARYLEVGTRSPNERAEYPDIDLVYVRDGNGHRFTRKDGTEY